MSNLSTSTKYIYTAGRRRGGQWAHDRVGLRRRPPRPPGPRARRRALHRDALLVAPGHVLEPARCLRRPAQPQLDGQAALNGAGVFFARGPAEVRRGRARVAVTQHGMCYELATYERHVTVVVFQPPLRNELCVTVRVFKARWHAFGALKNKAV